MFSRLSIVIGRDLNYRLRGCGIKIWRSKGNISSTANDTNSKESVCTKQEDKTELDSCDYLGVSETFEANVGEEEILVTETKEEISRTFGLGKYTAPDAYDGTLKKTNFGEIKMDRVRKGVIPQKKNFSKLKPKLGSIADSLISYRTKLDQRKYSLPVSDLLNQQREGVDKRGEGSVKEHSQSPALKEQISDCDKQRNVHQNSTMFNDSEKLPVMEKTVDRENILINEISNSSKPTQEGNEKQYKKESRELNKESDPWKEREEDNSLMRGARGDRFFMKPEDLVMEVVNEDENITQSKCRNNSFIKKKTDLSETQQVFRSSNTENIDWNIVFEENSEVKNSQKYLKKSDHSPQNIDEMLDSILTKGNEVEKQHIKDPCEQTHLNSMTNKVKKGDASENGAREKTISMDTKNTVMCENESRNKHTSKYDSNLLQKGTISSDRRPNLEPPKSKGIDWNYLLGDNNSEIKTSWKSQEKEDSSSHSLDRMLDSFQTKDKNVHQEGFENSFPKQLTPKDYYKSRTSKLGNAAYEYFHDEEESLGEGENRHNDEEENDSAEELMSLDDEMPETTVMENAAYKYFSDLQVKSLAPTIDATSTVDLSKFVPKNVNKLTEEEVVDELVGSILYNKDDILAINKIYGIPSQGGEGVRLNIADLLPKLAERIHCDKLHMVHRLDKETTGIMLFGKTEEMASKLKKAFKERKVKKTYLVITKGIPSLKEGIINVPIAEGEVGKDKRKRMTCFPVYDSDTKHVMSKSKRKTVPAVTHYKVVANSHSCALLEVHPETGVKHQIRTHLLHVLNTPVLGDHKYSYLTEIKPQILPSDVIRQLGIRQSKARNLPMYLHSKSLMIPEFLSGRTFSVHCSVPRAFRSFLKKTKISHRNVDDRD